MKHHRKIRRLLPAFLAALLLAIPFSAYAESRELSQQEFEKVCADNHAGKSRSVYPPLKNPDPAAFNYEYHYREILLSSDGQSFTDNPLDMGYYRDLAAGQIIMDMEEGWEISYEYHIMEEGKEDVVIEGGEITPYYTAVPLSSGSGSEKQYTYVSNEPDDLPVIPDFPKNYDWRSHGDTTLLVSCHVTLRSSKDGSEHRYTSRISDVTNLYKSQPDCYSLGPTDLGAYTIGKGDSLQKIAARHYGNSEDWIYILERNQDKIKNADMIAPGTLIVIPNAEAKK